MKIEISSNQKTCSLKIKPFFASSEKKKSPASKLECGEWLLTEKGDDLELHFCMSTKWNSEQMASQFRLLTTKSKKHWGASPVMETDLPAENLKAALRGIFMSKYSSNPAKETTEQKLYLATEPESEHLLTQAKAEAETQMWAMHLVDLPPNKKTPEMLGAFARKSAKTYGFECDVWNADHIIKDHLDALHAVGKGSENEPVFIISQYMGNPDSKEIDLAMVGKGITFDTGGISIKASANLHYMKSDMAGAAAMLASIELAARLKLRLNIVVIIPSAENSVDAKSVLPGAVINSYSGKTIEVIDTDAEGRLVLADGIAWVLKNKSPKILIDMATLTGSSVRALGNEAAALYSSSDKLAAALFQAGLESGEKVWLMPLWAEYLDYIKSDVADIANLSQKPIAGSIVAAKFLEFFTENHPAWAHIDMPGMSFKDSPFNNMKSATGYGVQLLSTFMQRLVENPEMAAKPE